MMQTKWFVMLHDAHTDRGETATLFPLTCTGDDTARLFDSKKEASKAAERNPLSVYGYNVYKWVYLDGKE